MHHPTLLAALTALASIPSAQAGLYSKSSPVLQVNARTFDSLIAKSNHTSVCCAFAFSLSLLPLSCVRVSSV